ncbi:MAG: hypothetical protein CVT49_14045 [candidate division Zixibacteria bacterium HGW-Zixibacteria-1]|nr:MAG: hypothetical protein CVT49_14045 [candidate division Zixibacteria bacterium HGW-Zixibacteria-1]
MIAKVAIPVWQERVSPVMDSACQLMVADFDDGKVVAQKTFDIPQLHNIQKVRFLQSLGIKVLICGAISQELESLLADSGIEVNPFFRGRIGDIINAFCNGNLQNEHFFLPGCRFGGRGQQSGRCQRRRGLRRGRLN